jgi:hypothetical protein
MGLFKKKYSSAGILSNVFIDFGISTQHKWWLLCLLLIKIGIHSTQKKCMKRVALTKLVSTSYMMNDSLFVCTIFCTWLQVDHLIDVFFL